MNSATLTANLPEFITTLRTQRLQMGLALEQAQTQYGGTYQSPEMNPCAALTDVDVAIGKTDSRIYAVQQQGLRRMKEMLERVDCALRLLEEGGPQAQLLAYQALKGAENPGIPGQVLH